MHTITYNLRLHQAGRDGTDRPGDSSAYYRDIARFSSLVIAETERLVGDAVTRYRAQVAAQGVEEARTREEYGFELLILGTLWRTYSGDASALDPLPQQFLQGLVELRRQGGPLKPGIDLVRGVLSTVFLAPDLYDHLFELASEPRHLEKLLAWLEASGEFHEECLRLRLWQGWLNSIPAGEAAAVLGGSLSLAAWFEEASLEHLGPYTAGVERYLHEKRPERYWQEDVIFCGRRRVEYHLNMVGAEIMNRSLGPAFRSAPRKAVVLPACMRRRRPEDCRAVAKEGRLECTGCLASCPVAIISQAGRQAGFGVMMVAHESSLSASRTDSSFLTPETGVVGVACVLNLVAGGWMLRRRGVPTQCVLLDYCGCAKHWSHEGMPTEIDLRRLAELMAPGGARQPG